MGFGPAGDNGMNVNVILLWEKDLELQKGPVQIQPIFVAVNAVRETQL